MDEERREFVRLARDPDANRRELCRRFGISPTTGYRWLSRAETEEEITQLTAHSRRPLTSPGQTSPDLEEEIIALRDAHPTWGARKLRAWLQQHGRPAPAASTITAILHRHGRIGPDAPGQIRWQRFEHPVPNALWQMDFMGHRALHQDRVHPLTILDDHSRYGLALDAYPHEQGEVVRRTLVACFERYGLPWAILADNGPPWGSSRGGITSIDVWLIRLGITVVHGRPYHPQTQGKIERWHRTIAADVFGFQTLPDLATAQRAFDTFRASYNHDRPHDALDLTAPGSRYQVSDRSYPATLPEPIYDDQDARRKVRGKGEMHFAGRRVFLGEGLAGEWVGVRPTEVDGVYTVHFGHQLVAEVDLRIPE